MTVKNATLASGSTRLPVKMAVRAPYLLRIKKLRILFSPRRKERQADVRHLYFNPPTSKLSSISLVLIEKISHNNFAPSAISASWREKKQCSPYSLFLILHFSFFIPHSSFLTTCSLLPVTRASLFFLKSPTS